MKKFFYLLLVFLLASFTVLYWTIWKLKLRTVDGRTAAQWIGYANEASKTVTYTATGTTTLNGKTAKFELNQSKNGKYQMDVTGDNGKQCKMGCDGKKAWFIIGDKHSVVDMMPAQDISGMNALIINNTTIAERPGIIVLVKNNNISKRITIDREYGVILSMITTRGKEISKMEITKINYKDVRLGNNKNMPTVVRSATADEIHHLLGRDALHPGWLPNGMKLRGEHLDWCDCCHSNQRNMVVTSYSDGISAVTLFQMSGTHHCAMASGCHMAPSNQALIETRMIGKTTIVAVTDIDKKSFTKMLDSLR
ncbi:MAG: hypothetical protein WCO98_10735 [bacterium]